MREVVITLLIAILIFFIFKDNSIEPNSVTITRIDTIYKKDTLIKYQKGENLVFKIIDSFPKNIFIHDTVSIVKDYLTVKAYSDTIRQDSNTFFIQDTISQNKIQGRSFKAELTQRTIFSTTTITLKAKNELYLGLLGDLRRFDNKVGLGVGLIYKDKNRAYSLGITTNQINIGYYVRVF